MIYVSTADAVSTICVGLGLVPSPCPDPESLAVPIEGAQGRSPELAIQP